MAKKSEKDFQSEYFDDADDLVHAKNEAWNPVSTKRRRVAEVRRWTNLMPTLAPETAVELNRTEITNFGLVYRASQQNEAIFMSMVTGTNALAEIIVDTDNSEQDAEWGQRMSTAVNEGAVHHKGKVMTMWKKTVGEGTIAGGVPMMQSEKYGWLAKPMVDMFFPPETELDVNQVTYAFNPVELSVYALEKMVKSCKEDGRYLNKKNLELLLKALRQKIKERDGMSTSNAEHEVSKSVRRDGEMWSDNHTVTIPAWWYYEVKYKDNGDSYVSATLFSDGMSSLGDYADKLKDEAGVGTAAKVICYIDEAYESPEDWLTMVCFDSEIGGVKTMDTLRGVSELIYGSSVEIEELFNILLEGDKERAKPFYTTTEDSVDAALAWAKTKASLAPAGLAEMDRSNGHQALQTPISMLMGNVASLTASPMSNTGRDQELRQQAVERQQSNATSQGSRQAEAYIHLDSLLETMVYRIFTAPVKQGTEGYNEIMWVRAQLERYGIPFEKLAAKEHGRFKYIKVRAHRAPGALDRPTQVEISDWLVEKVMPQADPAIRPMILKRAIITRTQDPDLADAIVKSPKMIINQQKLTAENECDTILRRAPLGQVLPVMPGDISQDHIPIHMLDMQALLARNEAEPWKRLDVLRFAGLAEHTAEHLKILLTNPMTNAEAKPFLRDYQKLTASAAAITKIVEETEGSEVSQLSAKEQAELQLKWADHQLKAQQFGLKVEDTRRIWENREARATLSRRQQFSREVNEDRRLKHDTVRVGLDAQKTEAQVAAAKKAPAKKTPKKK